jgi:hypothetical protein
VAICDVVNHITLLFIIQVLVYHSIMNDRKKTALFWAITWLVVIIPYRRFGTNYRSHLQGSRILEHLKMGRIGCPATLVRNYHYSPRNSPEVCSSFPEITYSRKLPTKNVVCVALEPKLVQQMEPAKQTKPGGKDNSERGWGGSRGPARVLIYRFNSYATCVETKTWRRYIRAVGS